MSIQSDAALSIAGRLKALGDPVRLRLLQEISRRPGGESCVCDLLDLFDLSQPTVSHHLKVLRESGLVASERRGTWVYYRVVPTALAEVTEVLTEAASVSGAAQDCCE